MNVYSDRPPLYYTCTTCHQCFSKTVNDECPYCENKELKERLKRIEKIVNTPNMDIDGCERLQKIREIFKKASDKELP